MKEATGELSTTVIAIVAIAAIATLFTVFLLPVLRTNIILGQACTNGPGYNQQNEDGSSIICGSKGADNAADNEWVCTYKKTADGAASTKTCSDND